MSIRILILSPLAILTFGGMSSPAIAEPVSNNTHSPITPQPQWSNAPNNTSENPPQWSNLEQPRATETPQWSETSETEKNAVTAPQWTELSPAIAFPASTTPIVAEISPLPHQLPKLPLPNHRGDGIAQTPAQEGGENLSDFETTTPATDAEIQSPSSESSSGEIPSTETQPKPTETPKTPLTHFSTVPTAQQLEQGVVVFNLYNRFFFVPNQGNLKTTPIYPSVGFNWGVSDQLELGLELQYVDSAGPFRQGEFTSNRQPDANAARSNITVEAKQHLWEDPSQTFKVSGVFSLALSSQGYNFSNGRVAVSGRETSLVPTLAIPLTAQWGNVQATLAPTVAFFPESNAIFFYRPPVENPGSFGTTFGFTGAVSWALNPRLVLYGDAFVPLTGNNSVSQNTGKPAQTVAYNLGFRYLVNPRVALDIFASNTLASKGAVALTADRTYTALGVGVVFVPDFLGKNNRYADSFKAEFAREKNPLNLSGLGLFDRGTLNGGQVFFDVAAGSQSLFTSLSYGLVKDLEIGLYLNYTYGTTDESEQGISGKVRLLNQAEGDPLTLSLGATYSLTNEPFANYIANNSNEFNNRNLKKTLPFVFDRDNLDNGILKIITLSLPTNYQFENNASLWFTPIFGYVQTLGVEAAGFNAGGLLPVSKDFALIGEVGANFAGKGNAFANNVLTNAIPWTFAIRWAPDSYLGSQPSTYKVSPSVAVYFTNRVGFTPWEQLRVLGDGTLSIGASFSVSF